ncbi:MAG: DUF3553 domain-containing protein [Phycisphaerales bacterium]
MTNASARYSFGDRVFHPGKPEWGIGTVTAAANAADSGRPCQRLTIRFERGGLKTLSTAYAPLRLATASDNAAPNAESPTAEPAGTGWLSQLEGSRNIEERMAELPESTRDPFTTLQQRLRATYDLFRFTRQGAPLLDWAATQTGLSDPLSKFNRHELELFFDRYAAARDAQVVALLREIKKKEPGALDAAIRDAPSTARNAIRRFNATR